MARHRRQRGGGWAGVTYSFGHHLQEHRKVPVGLILASCGGTRIQTWISASAIEPFEKPKADEKPVSHNDRSALYNGMIHPLLNYRLRGAIWCQGESNAAGNEAFNYRNLLSAMIRSWRTEFRNPDLAFHVVQLPPNGSGPDPVRSGFPFPSGRPEHGSLAPQDAGEFLRHGLAMFRPFAE